MVLICVIWCVCCCLRVSLTECVDFVLCAFSFCAVYEVPCDFLLLHVCSYCFCLVFSYTLCYDMHSLLCVSTILLCMRLRGIGREDSWCCKIQGYGTSTSSRQPGSSCVKQNHLIIDFQTYRQEFIILTYYVS